MKCYKVSASVVLLYSYYKRHPAHRNQGKHAFAILDQQVVNLILNVGCCLEDKKKNLSMANKL